MSFEKKIAGATIASFGSKAVTLVLNLVLIPVLTKSLGSDQAGIWLLVGQSAAFLGLLDFGLTPTFSRRIAFAAGSGMAEKSRQQVVDLIALGKRLFFIVGIAILLIGFPLGGLGLNSLTGGAAQGHSILLVWFVICVGNALNTFNSVWGAVMVGLGHVAAFSWYSAVVQGISLLAYLIVAWLGGSLMGLACCQVGSAILLGVGGRLILSRKAPEILAAKGDPKEAPSNGMIQVAFRYWLTCLGAFLILKTDQYFIASYKGAGSIPAYQGAYLLFNNVYIVAVMFSTLASSFVSQAWSAGDSTVVRGLVIRNARIGMCVCVCGIYAILSSAPALFNAWLGEGAFVGYPVLGCFSLMILLETHHVILAESSRATENEVFVYSALGAGIINIGATAFLGAKFGLVGIAAGTVIAQVLTNNWFVPWMSLKRLAIKWDDYTTNALKTPFLLLLTCASLLLLKQYLAYQGWMAIAYAFVTTSVMMLWVFLRWEKDFTIHMVEALPVFRKWFASSST